jgi:hypothetical protein
MSELEVKLTEVMVKLVVQFPDGLERIQSAYESVLAAGEEMVISEDESASRVSEYLN